MNCKKCGARLSADARFCMVCGEKVDGVVNQVQPVGSQNAYTKNNQYYNQNVQYNGNQGQTYNQNVQYNGNQGQTYNQNTQYHGQNNYSKLNNHQSYTQQRESNATVTKTKKTGVLEDKIVKKIVIAAACIIGIVIIMSVCSNLNETDSNVISDRKMAKYMNAYEKFYENYYEEHYLNDLNSNDDNYDFATYVDCSARTVMVDGESLMLIADIVDFSMVGSTEYLKVDLHVYKCKGRKVSELYTINDIYTNDDCWIDVGVWNKHSEKIEGGESDTLLIRYMNFPDASEDESYKKYVVAIKDEYINTYYLSDLYYDTANPDNPVYTYSPVINVDFISMFDYGWLDETTTISGMWRDYGTGVTNLKGDDFVDWLEYLKTNKPDSELTHDITYANYLTNNHKYTIYEYYKSSDIRPVYLNEQIIYYDSGFWYAYYDNNLCLYPTDAAYVDYEYPYNKHDESFADKTFGIIACEKIDYSEITIPDKVENITISSIMTMRSYIENYDDDYNRYAYDDYVYYEDDTSHVKVYIPDTVTYIRSLVNNANIYCSENSYARTYALENNISYEIDSSMAR